MKKSWLLLYILCITFVLLSCDGVGVFIFSNESVHSVRPLGLKSVACGKSLPCLTGSCRWLDFSLLSTSGERIVPGSILNQTGQGLEAGENFSKESFHISRAFLFEVGNSGDDKICTTNDDCLDGFSCLLPSESGLSGYYYLPQRLCMKSVEVEAMASPNFVHFREDLSPDNDYTSGLNTNGAAISLVLDNSSTLDGSQGTGIPDPATALDGKQYRKVALYDFFSEIFHEKRSELLDNIQISFHFMNGTGSEGVYGAQDAFYTKLSSVEAFLNSSYPSPSGFAPVFEALYAGFQKLSSADASYSRSLVGLVAGEVTHSPEDAYTELVNYQQSSQLSSLHIVQLRDLNHGTRPDSRFISLTDRSCGSYFFLDNPAQMQNVMQNIGSNIESHWSLPLHIQHSLPQGTWFRLGFSMELTVPGQKVLYEAHRIQEYNQTIDNRFMIYEF